MQNAMTKPRPATAIVARRRRRAIWRQLGRPNRRRAARACAITLVGGRSCVTTGRAAMATTATIMAKSHELDHHSHDRGHNHGYDDHDHDRNPNHHRRRDRCLSFNRHRIIII